MDKISKQEISKETEVLNNTINQLDLTFIYGTLHPTAEGYTFFSNVHGTFLRIDMCSAIEQVSVNMKGLKSR